MTIKTKDVVVTQTTYVAMDGTEFNSKLECEDYEFSSPLLKSQEDIWVVFPLKRSICSSDIELFSTKELANLSLKHLPKDNKTKYSITSIKTDIRFTAGRSVEGYPELGEILSKPPYTSKMK